MQGHLETVKDGVLPPDEQTVDTIYQQVRHVVKLVDGLRLLVLADAGVIHPDRQSSSIEDLLSQAAEAFRPTGEFKSVSLDIQLLGRLPLVSIHRTRIAQVVSNLLDNALFHTPSGGGGHHQRPGNQ